MLAELLELPVGELGRVVGAEVGLLVRAEALLLTPFCMHSALSFAILASITLRLLGRGFVGAFSFVSLGPVSPSVSSSPTRPKAMSAEYRRA